MNIALIIAGGMGWRMQNEVPKQFMNVNDKPVIIYTLEAFERHPDIAEIGVSCLDGWQQILQAYAKQYHITKLKWVVDGGKNGQDSIRNGTFEAEKRYDSKDILLVHDAIRPLVSQEIISDNIAQCKRHGSAITMIPCTTAMLRYYNKENSSCEVVPRDELAMTQTPQAFLLGKLADAHRRALEQGITDSVASCEMMISLGERVHFSSGAETNIKLTTQNDMQIFRAMLGIRGNE